MKTKNLFKSLIGLSLIVLFMSNCAKDSDDPDPVATASKPTVTTADVTAITQLTAKSGGNVTADGGAEVNSRGVCYATVTMPTIANLNVLAGTGKGTFTTDLTGLALGVKYYLRAFATNSAGTAYGEEKIFTTDSILTIGLPYAGGLIFYLDASKKHGLVCADTNQGDRNWGCYKTLITGAAGVTVGTGKQNTADIIKGCSASDCAAAVCDKLVRNGYSDWFLPSEDELMLMYTNLHAKGMGKFSNAYWSSTQTPGSSASDFARHILFSIGNKQSGGKNIFLSVRAVRAF